MDKPFRWHADHAVFAIGDTPNRCEQRADFNVFQHERHAVRMHRTLILRVHSRLFSRFAASAADTDAGFRYCPTCEAAS